MGTLSQLINQLPAPLPSVAASAYGYYLRAWRYGPGTDQRIHDALERETWPPERWKEWQEERLARLLDRAARKVPFYRGHWQDRRRNGDRASWDQLENWPILKKESLRKEPEAFLVEDAQRWSLLRMHTSGTSGKPLSLWQSRASLRDWYAINEARTRRWNGLSDADHWAIIGGRTVVPYDRAEPPFWVWNHAFRQLYMSAYHISKKWVIDYLDALRRYEVRYIVAYPSAASALASFARDADLEAPKIDVFISNAEPLSERQRALIHETFRCHIQDTYGVTEKVVGATECLYGEMHLWPEAGVIEVVADDSSSKVTDSKPGRLICTGLLLDDMPLIRYEVGDRASLMAADVRCRCGRTLPMLDSIEGRVDDVIITKDGRLVGRLDPIFKADLPIRAAQIVQETISDVCVKVVPSNGFREEDEQIIIRRLRDRIGDMQIRVESVPQLPITQNGKVRGVVSHVRQPQNSVAK